jgi:hypothetical protein
MSKRKRLFSVIMALLLCHLVPYFGAVWNAPLSVVVACYLLAVFAVFFIDHNIHKCRMNGYLLQDAIKRMEGKE